MNIIDIIIAVILLIGAVRGFMKGFILEIAMLIALIAGALGAHKLAHIASPFLQNHFSMSSAYLSMVSFAIVFILSLIFYVIHPIDEKFHLISEEKKTKSFFYQPVEKISGMVFYLSEIKGYGKQLRLKIKGG